MKVKIKKGVRPYPGKTFEVIGIREGLNGKIFTIEAGLKRGTFGYHSDPREYYENEVEIKGE